VPGQISLGTAELLDAIAALASGCPEGFKLAWIAVQPEIFEALARAEYPIVRSGIAARVFFDEHSAVRWLSW
jgi:hypothetical protein